MVIDRALQDTVSENDPLALAPRESLTLIVGEDVPMVVGVPEINPPVARERPAGRVLAVIDQVYGGVPPVADI